MTSGSPQAAVASGCPYPAFTNATGFIGTISTYLIDGDIFVVETVPGQQGGAVFRSTGRVLL